MTEPSWRLALTLLGPRFHPVTPEDYAAAHGCSIEWATAIFRRLADGREFKERHARRISATAWAITDAGQKRMGWPKTANQAHYEWLLVQCDRFLDDAEHREEVLDVFWWTDFKALDSPHQDKSALAIGLALAESGWISEGRPRQKAKTVFLRAAEHISTRQSAARMTVAIQAMGDKKFDQWRRAIRKESQQMHSGTFPRQCYLSAWMTSRNP
jgi:hypothetical protein